MNKINNIQSFLENNKIFKLILSIVIIFTVLPVYDNVSSMTGNILDYAFLTIFGIEVLFRIVVYLIYLSKHIKDKTFSKTWKMFLVEFIFLLIDILATMSFLPMLQTAGFKLLRLLRIVKLSRYVTSTFREIGQIIGQPGIKRQLVLTFGAVLVLTFLAGIIFPYIVTEDTQTEMSFAESLWWSFQTLFDPGNLEVLDEDALDVGKLLLSLSLVFVGVFIFSFIIGLGTEVVAELIEATKNKQLNHKDHVILFGWNKTGSVFINELLDIMEDNMMNNHIVVIQDVDETLPDRLGLKSRQLTVRYFVDDAIEALEKANVTEAQSILILPRLTEKADDSNVIQKILEVRSSLGKDLNSEFDLIATMEDPLNLSSGLRSGADSIVLPDVFMGSYMVQNILTPNLLDVYEELLVPTGNEIYISSINKIPDAASSKYISMKDLHETLLENDCTFLGIIEKTGETKNDFEALSNPLEWYNRNDKSMYTYDVLPKSEIAGVIGLADNSMVLDNALRNMRGNKTYTEKVIHRSDFNVIENIDETKELNVLLFGWNYSVPAIIQQLISLSDCKVNITLFINNSYEYPKSKRVFIKKKIREFLAIYYKGDNLDLMLSKNKINFKLGSYFSETDLFGKSGADITSKDIVIMLPDEHKKTNPDADIFLVVLMILSYFTENRAMFKKSFKIYAHAVGLESAKKLEERIKAEDTENIFNVISSERIIGAYLAQTSICRYIPKTYNSLLTNDDLNTMSVVSIDNFKNIDDFNKLINDNNIINYKDISAYFFDKKILLIGYEIGSGDDRDICINPMKDIWDIDTNKDISFILLNCQENDFIKKVN